MATGKSKQPTTSSSRRAECRAASAIRMIVASRKTQERFRDGTDGVRIRARNPGAGGRGALRWSRCNFSLAGIHCTHPQRRGSERCGACDLFPCGAIAGQSDIPRDPIPGDTQNQCCGRLPNGDENDERKVQARMPPNQKGRITGGEETSTWTPEIMRRVFRFQQSQ